MYADAITPDEQATLELTACMEQWLHTIEHEPETWKEWSGGSGNIVSTVTRTLKSASASAIERTNVRIISACGGNVVSGTFERHG